MKVFKMNQYDWVAANTAAEAVEWYLKNTGFDWIEDASDVNPIECDLDAPIKFRMEERDNILCYGHSIQEDSNLVTTTLRNILIYNEALSAWCGKEPYVILSTEY